MKSLTKLMALTLLLSTTGFAQSHDPMLGENITKISDHVWAIMGFPNIAIVAGSHATLVVDTGLGAKNGATIARVAAKLAPHNSRIFLTTTHFHPCICRSAPVSVRLELWGSRGIGSPAGGRLPFILRSR
jgi:hypothetical protein